MQERCRGMQAYASIDAGECKHMQASMQANASICKHRCRNDAARVLHGCCIDAEECKHTQASMQGDAARVLHGCCTGAGTMQANASTRKHRCRNDAARVQERCSTGAGAMQHGCCTGAGTMQERCCIDAEGANAGSASMLCVHSIALHAGESGIDGAGKRNMLAVCLHCLHFSEQRITARRGGKRGVRGEMRGIVRRVPTCGAFRCAAGGRREDEEDYGERRQRRGIVRRVPTCGAVRRRRLRPIRPLLRRRMPDPLAGAGLLPLVDRLEPSLNPSLQGFDFLSVGNV